MACCIFVAALIAQLIAIWKTRKRRILFIAGSSLCTVLLAWQLVIHWHHLAPAAGGFIAKLQNSSDIAVTTLHDHQ